MNRAPTISLLAVSCTLFALGAMWARPSRADISFTPIGILDVGGNNYSVITSDLNRDGALDLVSTSLEFDRASVFLGNGNGTFRPRSDVTANSPHSVAAGDLNLDGIPDLLVANGAGTVSVLIGVGDGTFVRGADFEASPNPYFVGIADLNGDGRPDVIGAVFSSIFVRLGNGHGAFGPRSDVPLSGCAVGEIQTADLDGDGRLDLAVTNNCSGLVHILMGNGDGSFQPPLSYSAAGSPLSCDIGDLNGDGRLDIVVSGGSTLAVSVFLGNGDGTFLPRAEFGTDVEPIGVRIGNFNSDTIPDLAVITGEGRALDVLAGRGDGTFDPKHGYPTGPGYALAVGDWDRDGLLDLVATASDQIGHGHDLALFRNTPGVPVGHSPVLTAPSSVSGNVGSEITFTVSVSDPDGDPITELGASPPPPGASFTVNPSKTSGTFRWTPSPGQQGDYRVVFYAHNSLAASAKTLIHVGPGGSNQPPVLDPIGSKAVNELALLSFTATATDPDAGQTLTFLLYFGAPAATGATLNGTTGAFSWTPTEAQGPGSYSITVQVVDNGSPQLNAAEGITIAVNEVNVAPVLGSIGNKVVFVGSTLAFTATATDSDIPANTLCFSTDTGSPPGVTMNCTGAFTWTPSPGQIGSFVITVRVTDNGTPPLSDAETITVTVVAQTTAPTADAGGPYSGVANDPVTFDGTGSSDPNGDPLTYAWDFGDGSTGTGATPLHTYTAPGTYNVTLRVTDPGGNFDEDITTATIGDQISVALVLKNGQSTLSLGKGDVRVAIEEIALQYTSVIIGSLRLSTDYPNAGTVSECAADPKHTRIGDLDHNGVPDLEARFSSACLSNLFRNTPNNTVVNLIITGEAQTSTGTVPLNGVAVVTIKKGGGGGAPVVVYPNPMNPQAILSFETMKAGGASVQLFDLQGRLVRTLLPQQHLEAGAHEVTIDGLNDQGVRLSSGIYFYRVRTADGTTEGSISVLK